MVELQPTTVFQEKEICVRHEIIISNPHKKSRATLPLCVQKLFTAELRGYKINNNVIINILISALCYCESLFAVCRSLDDCPTDKTIADNLIKLLPSYQKLQQEINTILAEQLSKKFFKKAHRLAIDLVLIPYHG